MLSARVEVCAAVRSAFSASSASATLAFVGSGLSLLWSAAFHQSCASKWMNGLDLPTLSKTICCVTSWTNAGLRQYETSFFWIAASTASWLGVRAWLTSLRGGASVVPLILAVLMLVSL